MAGDALYDSMLVDPLSIPIEEVVAAEEESKGPSEEEIAGGMTDRIVAVLKSRSDAYKGRGEQADDGGATETAKLYIAVASELAFLSGELKAGQIEELEKAGK